MIDYFFKFNTEALAIASAAGTTYYIAGVGWHPDCVVPNVQVWRPSLDNGDGSHNYLPGWFGIISTPDQKPALLNHANLQLAINRDISAAGRVAILQNNIPAILQDVMFSPVFAGSNYPFGNLQ